MFKEIVKNLSLSHFSEQMTEVFCIMSANTSNFWQNKLITRIYLLGYLHRVLSFYLITSKVGTET